MCAAGDQIAFLLGAQFRARRITHTYFHFLAGATVGGDHFLRGVIRLDAGNNRNFGHPPHRHEATSEMCDDLLGQRSGNWCPATEERAQRLHATTTRTTSAQCVCQEWGGAQCQRNLLLVNQPNEGIRVPPVLVDGGRAQKQR